MHVQRDRWVEASRYRAGGTLATVTEKLHGMEDVDKEEALAEIRSGVETLAQLQEALYAEQKHGLLIVLQGLDTAGKDGTIRAIFDGVNPQGVTVSNFRVPTPEEASHDYLYRVHQRVPARGMVGIFNRSHYEDLIVPVATGGIGDDEFDQRVHQVKAFEEYLIDQRVKVVKLYLNVSWKVQGERLLRRLDRPDKHWKFSSGDLATRQRWNDFHGAYQRVISATSFEDAPWYVIPADKRWYRDLVALQVVLEGLSRLAPKVPAVAIEHIKRYRAALEQELREEETK